MTIEDSGKEIDKINVHLSYRIIELFSKGLYSSPNKAFEELVCNAYDALADKVAIYVPSDTSTSDATMWICDNGESLDENGLKELWRIGESSRREGDELKKARIPIGKFGIGKLATYILARKLTHICKKDGRYLAVTMDYGRIPTVASNNPLILSERELTEKETIDLLSPLINKYKTNFLNFNLWGANAEKSWTFAIMSDLTTKASELKLGRLSWVLSTSLPLSPAFKLFFNGQDLESSKIKEKIKNTWIIGQNDLIATKFNDYKEGTYLGMPCVNLPHLENVYGQIDLYEDSLLKGKASEHGRSHGIFLMIRGRLINLDDPLLGMSPLSHGVFNRVRIVIHADGLDSYLSSTREAVQESNALIDLRHYIQRKFEEVKEYYFNQLNNEALAKSASYKVSQTSTAMSRQPLVTVAKKFLNEEIEAPFLIEIPNRLTEPQKGVLISRLEEDVTSEKGIIKDVIMQAVDIDAPIAKLDMETGQVKINILHPFFVNFISEFGGSTLPFELIAITEILTEALMIENEIPQEKVTDIMSSRDKFLRQLVFSDRPKAPAVAQLIKEAIADPTGLEKAVAYAFNSLGFETTPIGGKGKPDGKAVACIGLTGSGGTKRDYSVLYEAKSTSNSTVSAKDLNIAGVVRHRTDYGADYSVIVAIDFDGSMDDNSAASKEARAQKVSLIRAKDLIALVLLASPKKLGFLEFKDLFANNFTVIETSKWINDLNKKTVDIGPIREVLEVTLKLQKSDMEPPDLSGLRHNSSVLNKYSKDDLRSLIQSVNRLVGNLISLDGEKVSIQSSPDRIMDLLQTTVTREIPPEYTELYIKTFSDTIPKNKKPDEK